MSVAQAINMGKQNGWGRVKGERAEKQDGKKREKKSGRWWNDSMNPEEREKKKSQWME